jgi:indole-3-glycerol phosphate synthase
MDMNAAGTGFLRRMVEEVRGQVMRGAYDLGGQREITPPAGERLASALTGGRRPGIMVELKHASPGHRTAGLRTPDPERFVELARAGGAQALSVVPQDYRFGGSLREFAEVTRRSTLPVLFKDFILDPRQLRAARRLGARAALLLARLEREGGLLAPLATLVEEAHRVGLEALVEVHQEEDVPLALAARPDLLGVNARDLETLELDRDRALRTLHRARGCGVPLIGMSGIAGPEEVRAYLQAGADGVLVGTRFLEAEDPVTFLRSLRVQEDP